MTPIFVTERIPVVHRTLPISAGSILALEANPYRTVAVIQNDSDTDMYMSFTGPAAANQGIRLNSAGGAWTIDVTTPWPGQVHVYCAGAAKNVLVTEY